MSTASARRNRAARRLLDGRRPNRCGSRWHVAMNRVGSVARHLTLASIRAIHTLIFAVELTCIGWLIVSGAIGRRDRSVGLAAGLVAVESAVWVANDHVCPLTPLADRLGAGRGSVSDIYLPDLAARTLPIWSSALLVLAAALHLRSLVRARRSMPPV